MSLERTQYYNFETPLEDNFYDIEVHNRNMQKTDDELHRQYEQINVLYNERGYFISKIISNTDLNNLTENGKYTGQFLTNSPTGALDNWYNIEVSKLNEAYIEQKATFMTGNQFTKGTVFIRTMDFNTWQPWIPQATTTKTDILVTPTNGLKVAGNNASFVEEIAGIKIYHGELIAEAPITGNPVVLTLPNFTSTKWRHVTFVNQNTKESYSGWCYLGGIVRVNLPAGQYQVDISYT